MAQSLEKRVEGLTGLQINENSNPNRADLNDYIHCGLIDVTVKVQAMNPSDLFLFTKETTLSNSTPTLAVDSTLVTNVQRYNSTTAQWLTANIIDVKNKNFLSDEASIHYTDKSAPSFYIEGGTLSVYPTPTASENAKVDHVAFPNGGVSQLTI